ncbi:unnamed protein product, partial [Brenthis ino]
MTENNQYRCVNCGEAATALYRTYGPSVLKLTKCESCKGIVDKYIEYDPVIVMIDLVLMSREAQRHVIYNTEFKLYWKLFIVLLMLETFATWRNDSLFTITVNTLCNIKSNGTDNSTQITLPINITIPEPWNSGCKGWDHQDKDSVDLFIWEKDFYVQFLSTLAGIIVFISTSHLMMTLLTFHSSKDKAPARRVLRALCVAQASALAALPALAWARRARIERHATAALYGAVFSYSVFRVLYEGPRLPTALVLILSNCLKYLTTFYVMPIIRSFIT